jgi:hypothetical protein
LTDLKPQSSQVARITGMIHWFPAPETNLYDFYIYFVTWIWSKSFYMKFITGY